MGGGGKGGTSTSTVSIPPEVLARYNAVNAQANTLAGIDPTTGKPNTPFQAYGGEFVAPMNTVQQQGVSQTQQYASAAQPYYNTAAGLTQQAVNAAAPLTAAQIQQYQNPYIQSVVDPTLKALQQQQAVDRQNQAAQAIRAGAFGGERAGLARDVLAGQQELAQAQAISPLYAQAYQQALGAAQQQQGLGVQTAMQAGQQIAGIGTGAQQAGLQGAQAVIGAGTLGQQTQQALDTAQYQQFLQERGYPFQLTQFLANIAEGTGALSGSTTTTTQPTSFFSDKRLKTDIKKVGKTNDGLPIYSFKYKGDNRTQLGLMAQDVEKKRPEAVGLSGGYKTVDYDKATAGARHARAAGGLVPSWQGGAVTEPGSYNRGGFAYGGYSPSGNVDPLDMQSILAAQKQSFGPFAAGGLYGGSAQQSPMGGKTAGIVPTPNLPVPKLVTASAASRPQQTGLQGAMGDINTAAKTIQSIKDIKAGASDISNFFKGKDDKGGQSQPATQQADASKPAANPADAAKSAGQPQQKADFTDDTLKNPEITGDFPMAARGGGIMPRHGYATSGSVIPGSPSDDPLQDVVNASEDTKDVAEKEAPKPDGSRGGSGGGGLGSALGAAAGAIGAARGIGSFMSWLPTLFAAHGGAIHGHYANGGIVPRQHFDDGGPAAPQTDAPTLFSNLENQYQLPEGYLGRVHQIESSGGKNMSTSLSSAKGHFGFIDRTAREMGVNDPMDLGQSAEGAARYAAANREKLRAAGIDDPTGAHLYLAHQQGPQGAINLLTNPTGRSGSLVGDTAVTNNRGNPDASGLNFSNQIMGLYNGAKQAQPQMGGFEGARKAISDAMPSAPVTPAGEKQSWGDFLTSPRFLTPLGTGLLTMASSPSRYLGAAVLQGLGAGLAAVQPSEMAAQQIERQKIETALGAARLPQESIFERGGIVYITTRDGRVMDYGSWADAGKPEPVGGAIYAQRAEALQQQVKGGGLSGAAGSQKPQQQIQAQPAGAPKPIDAPAAPSAITLDDAAKAAAAKEEQDLFRLPQADRNARIAQNISNIQRLNDSRDASHILTGRLNALAQPLSELGAGQQITPGAFASMEYTIKKYFNDALKNAGLPELQVDETGRINYEKAQKAVEALKARGVEGLNLKAVSALDELAKGMAEPGKTKEAAASILADTYIDKQRGIDEANLTNDYKAGRNLTVSQGANDQYRRIFSDKRYDDERIALNKLLTTSLRDTGEPLINYFIGKGKDPRVTPQVINQLIGADVSRYFQAAPR